MWIVVAVAAGSACSGDGGESGAAASGDGAPACRPVGDGGGMEVAVTLAAEPASTPAGRVTFDVRNEGGEPHELVVVRATSPVAMQVVDGRVDEDALPEGAFVGEVEEFPAGATCTGTFELTPATYVLFCNLVETEDEELESHFEEGMATTFVVI